MATNMVMPKWGMTMKEGLVGEWLKSEGDPVERGEEIVEIESDKAVHLVEAPASGILARILVAAGETVPITTPIAVITDEGEAVPEDLPAATDAVEATGTARPAEPQPKRPPPARPRTGRVPASPVAKRLAREHDVDLATVTGSGPDGLVTVDDVQAVIDDGPTAATPTASGPVSRVEFFSRGCRLSGRLYLPTDRPDDADPLPGVILCLGYTYTQDLLVPDIARRLSETGRAVLIFDYRGFGRSEGTAEVVRPADQVEDIAAAVSFVSAFAEVDSARLALVGISLGGSNAISAAAIDPRVTAVVAISAPADGRRLLAGSRSDDDWTTFLERLDADRTARSLGRTGEIVDAWEIVVPDPDSRTFLDGLYAEYPQLACRLSLETADALLACTPEAVVSRIAPRPLLLIHGENDQLVPPAESQALHDAAGKPCQLDIIPDMAHFDWAIPDDARYIRVVDTVDTWLSEQLGSG